MFDDEKRVYDYGDDDDLPDDENGENLSGYTVIDEHSIFEKYEPEKEDEETIATPIPVNESTVILSEPQVAGLYDGKELGLKFEFENCYVMNGGKKAGELKPAFAAKLRAERGGQLVRVYYKADVPPMVRLVFGEGEKIPEAY